MICFIDFIIFNVFDYLIGEFVNVVRGFEDIGKSYDGSIEFKYIFFDDVVFLLGIENVGLKGGIGRFIVVKISDIIVDFKRRSKEELFS